MIPVYLYAPEEFHATSEEERREITGGCGPGGVGDWLISDTIWGLNIHSACEIHDWMYHFGTKKKHKKTADEVFRDNMIRLIAAHPTNSLLIKLRFKWARLYYKAVKNYGGPSFWDGKEATKSG